MASKPVPNVDVADLDRRYSFHPFTAPATHESHGPAAVMVRGDGVWLEDINEELGITVVMVEHDMNLVTQASDRVMALADGHLLTIGSPQEVQSHPEVLRAYLGD